MTLIFRYLNWSHCTIYGMYTCTNWSYWSGWLHKLVIPSWYKYDIVVLIPSGIPISGTSFTSGYCTISRYLNWSCCTLYDIYIYINWSYWSSCTINWYINSHILVVYHGTSLEFEVSQQTEFLAGPKEFAPQKRRLRSSMTILWYTHGGFHKWGCPLIIHFNRLVVIYTG